MKPEEQLEIDIQLLREFHRANHIERLHKALESASNISELCEFLKRELTAANERIKQLEEALDCVVVSCSYLHHRKKHQHEYGQPCPVENLIRKAKEAKP